MEVTMKLSLLLKALYGTKQKADEEIMKRG